ncbi:MAG: hypothetical protein ACREVV_16365 [Steroidobacteraceae bacterium]
MLSLLLLIAVAWVALSLACGLVWVLIVMLVDASRKRHPDKQLDAPPPVHRYRPVA